MKFVKTDLYLCIMTNIQKEESIRLNIIKGSIKKYIVY